MKASLPICAATRIRLGLLFSVAAIFLQREAVAGATVDLGAASNFAVLAGAGITITGPTKITGDIGTYPTATITGLGNLTLNGSIHAGDATAQNAQGALLTAYNDAAARAPTHTYDPIADLGGLSLFSGVYNDPTSLGITGTLTLDGGGNPNAVWIFQAGSTLITAANSKIVLIDGAQASNVFWQVGSSATLGTGSDFSGTILALTSITLDAGATVNGRVLAINGAVTLDSNSVNAPDGGETLWLFGFALASLLIFNRRLVSIA